MEYFKRSLQAGRPNCLKTSYAHSAKLVSVAGISSAEVPTKETPSTDDGGNAPASEYPVFRLTDSSVDREGDIVYSSGLDTVQWELYGSVLWGHDPTVPQHVLGTPSQVFRAETHIDAALRFAAEDENPTGAMVERMIRAGLVKGGSIGFVIKEFSEAQDRAGWMPINVMQSELVEFSITPIPCNPRAVVQEFPAEDDRKELIAIVEASVEEVCAVTEPEKDRAIEMIRWLTGHRKRVDIAAGNSLSALLDRLAKETQNA